MPEITDNTAQNRYEQLIDGQLCVADYRRDDTTLSITHVGVPPSLRGQGIAAQLMAGVVRDAKARGLSIIPVCPYAATYLQRHPL